MSLPAPPFAAAAPPPPPSGRSGPWQRLRSMPRRTLFINIGLALLLIIILVLALITAFAPRNNQNVQRTVAVTRGTVTASVTASGNAESSLATPVSFVTNGVLTAVAVNPGDSVTRGQVLATIDGASADTTLRTAQAQLDNAKAALAQTASGPTDVKKQQDALAVTQAQQGVDNANAAVTQAQDQLALDQTATDTAIANAKTTLNNNDKSTQTAVDQAKAKLAADTTTQNALVSQATCAPTTTPTTTTTTSPTPSSSASAPSVVKNTVNSLLAGSGTSASGPITTPANASDTSFTRGSSRSVSADSCPAKTNAENTRRSVLLASQQAVTNAQQARTATLATSQQAVTTAQQNQDATILKDTQAIETAKQQVTAAQSQVTAAQLAAEADLHPSTPDQIAQAQANVDQAQATFDAAQLGVTNTTLIAPQDGVVLSVAGKVGEVSTGGGSISTTVNASGTGGASSTSSSAASTPSGTGFIVIANLSKFAVTSDIAEADASKVRLGQPATITFPGAGATATGSVTQITPQSTVTNNVVQFPVQVSLDSAPPGVEVGSTASMSITTGSAVGVLVAPTSAITTVGNRHTVIVRRNGQDTVVPVEIGLSGDTTTEIISGVQAGDQLVLPTVTTATTGGFPRGGGGGGGG
jgi:HlyD family secretion protein